jgi:flagellar assembly protein FliH
LSSPSIIRDSEPLQSFGSILPSVAAATTQLALRTGGKAGRTAAELARLREEAESVGYKDGIERGFREGIERGIAQAHQLAYEEAAAEHAKTLAQFQAELGSVIESIQSALYEWCEQSEAEMAVLATDIARRVINAEMAIGRDAVLAMVKDGLREVTFARHARIRINPFDLPTLQEAKGELLACASSLRDIEFVEDPAILTGCVIETDGGIVDATADAKLATLDDELGAA